MTRLGDIKLKNIKCTKCAMKCEPYKETVIEVRDNCMKKASCGLHDHPLFDKLTNRELVVVPFEKKKETLHLPALLAPPVEECCDTHKSHKPLDEILEFSIPLTISLEGDRGKRKRKKR